MEHVDALPELQEFVNTERFRFSSSKANNLFGSACGAVLRYREYVGIIFRRYQEASEAFRADTAWFHTFAKDQEPRKSRQLTPEEFARLQESGRIGVMLHLEIESFYLFTKIMLDRVARLVEFLFGAARRLSMDSHDDLVKSLPDYLRDKGLTTSQPEQLMDTVRLLKERIADHRDYEIAHAKSPRAAWATTWGPAAAGPRIARFMIYPGERDTQKESESLEKLLPLVDDYLRMVMRLISDNHALLRPHRYTDSGPRNLLQ